MGDFKGAEDFPVLLLRRQVAFPRVVVRVLVGRKRSLALLKHLQKQGKVVSKGPTSLSLALLEPAPGPSNRRQARPRVVVIISARLESTRPPLPRTLARPFARPRIGATASTLSQGRKCNRPYP
eukprot:COSAG02_NODE_3593_length_6514_cov_9.846142_3_plen_124_part_00